MNMPLIETIALTDLHPATDTFLVDVHEGLAQAQKAIPAKYFYDARGSYLFDQITKLEEYYPTRTEMGIMKSHIDAMIERMGPRCLLVEYGSGSSLKTRILLDHLQQPAGYVPIDISKEHLLRSAETLALAYPGLPIRPICADYTTAFQLPDADGARPVVYFPGSTIGNFEPEEARAFLQRIVQIVGAGGGMLIGVDLRKEVHIIEAAYNDAEGVTAAFNKNVLARINSELGGTFDLNCFRHHAFFNATHSRIEMHLESLGDQCVRVADRYFPFRYGETILTEYSYKYTLEAFASLAASAGFEVEKVWMDEDHLFSVQYLVAR